MTTTSQMARFIQDTSFEDLPEEVIEATKKRLLDSIGIAMGARGAGPTEIVADTVADVDEDGPCRLWGSDGTASPPQAAMMNTALTRYLDFMDSFLAPGETPHPSDNIGSAVVCGQYAERSGKELIASIATAYEVQAALAWNAPVRDRGWDHVTHTIFSATAASAKLLDLSEDATRNALGIAGTAHNALRVTRTGGIGMWKGIASANTARNAVYSAMLADNGMEGPQDVFEGEKGWKHIVSGEFDCEYDRECSSVLDTMAKRYVAETYSQSAVEGLLELIEDEDIDPTEIDAIELTTFHGAYQIIGGGAGGDRHTVEKREQADHSLPYMLAVAALDGQLLDEQYEPDRIHQDDVQELLQRVSIEEDDTLTERFEEGEMPAVLDVRVGDETHHVEKADFNGHPNNPMTWDQIEEKFHAVAGEQYGMERREEIVECVRSIEDRDVEDLVALLDAGS